MNGRQRLIMIAVGGALGLALLYVLVDALLLSPVAKADRDITRLQKDIAFKNSQRTIYAAKARKLPTLASETFGSDEAAASEQLRSRLVTLIQRSGLPSDNLSLKPITGARVRDYYVEVGWSISARGTLAQAVSLMYLLNDEPYIHRIETFSLTPQGDGGTVDLKLRYTTVTLPEAKNEKLTGGEFAAADQTGDLRGEGRDRYAGIERRDLFRPYQPPPPPPPVARRDPPPSGPPPPPPPPPDASTRMKVVGLPTWAGEPEVQVLDTRGNKVTTYKPGEELAGGRIVMVDYRVMPMPGNEDVLSGSRVILEENKELWVVELGQTLSQKRPLPDSQRPAGLAVP